MNFEDSLRILILNTLEESKEHPGPADLGSMIKALREGLEYLEGLKGESGA